MAHIEKLTAEKRVRLGTAECRRLRRSGLIPGNIYGHGIDSLAIRVTEERLYAVLRSGAFVVEVDVEGHRETAVIRDTEWDTYGARIQHFDLLRVNPNERIEVDVPIELKGRAPGVTAGGFLDQPLHSLIMEVSAVDIPDSLMVRVSELEIGDELSISDLELPEGASISLPPETPIVRVLEPQEVELPEEGEAELGPAEPELVGREEKDEEAEAAEAPEE